MSDIHIKLSNIAGKVGPLNKTEKNTQQGFNFRSIEAMTSAVRPLFAAEGVSIAPRLVSLDVTETESAKGSRGYRTVVHMSYTFTAGSDDSLVEVSMPGEAVDYGDKSTSKAVQMAYKYALTQVLIIGSGDADPDTHTQEVGRPRRRQNPTTSPVVVQDAPNGEGAIDLEAKQWEAKQKLRLLEGVGGDREKAKAEWEAITRQLSGKFTEGEREVIEEEISSVLVANLPPEQAPFL